MRLTFTRPSLSGRICNHEVDDGERNEKDTMGAMPMLQSKNKTEGLRRNSIASFSAFLSEV